MVSKNWWFLFHTVSTMIIFMLINILNDVNLNIVNNIHIPITLEWLVNLATQIIYELVNIDSLSVSSLKIKNSTLRTLLLSGLVLVSLIIIRWLILLIWLILLTLRILLVLLWNILEKLIENAVEIKSRLSLLLTITLLSIISLGLALSILLTVLLVCIQWLWILLCMQSGNQVKGFSIFVHNFTYFLVITQIFCFINQSYLSNFQRGIFGQNLLEICNSVSLTKVVLQFLVIQTFDKHLNLFLGIFHIIKFN